MGDHLLKIRIRSVKMSSMSRFNRKGNVVVFVIIAIVVVAAIWIVNYMKTERFPVAENVSCSDEKFPWQEHSRIVLPGEEINTDLGQNMVDISDGLAFRITVEDTQYGNQMTLLIGPNGTVSGGWVTDHNKKGDGYSMNYNMNASFEGNIDPSCAYFDSDGEDYSKLFVTARGNVTIVAMNMKTDATGMSTNDIFVSGWINKDGKAKGNMGIILDSGNHKIYQWHSTN
jgi:hypothetical protein